jgi:hypothetical protein
MTLVSLNCDTEMGRITARIAQFPILPSPSTGSAP